MSKSTDTFKSRVLDYEESFDAADRRALSKVLSFYGIQSKYMKVISAIFEDYVWCPSGMLTFPLSFFSYNGLYIKTKFWIWRKRSSKQLFDLEFVNDSVLLLDS